MPTPRKKPPPRRMSRKPEPVKSVPPAPRPRNTRAVTNGASANGRNLPGYAETKAEVQAAIDAADWLQATDTIVLDLFCAELNAYRYTARVLAAMTPVASMKKLRAAGLQLRRGKLLLELANSMGFTAESRFKLGLTQAKTARAKIRAQPVRSEERAQQVAALLQQAGALPPVVVDAEIVSDEPDQGTLITPEPEPVVEESLSGGTPTPDEPEAEVIFFRHGGGA